LQSAPLLARRQAMLVVTVQSTVINDGTDCGMDTGIVRGMDTGIVRGMDTGMGTGIVRGTRLVGVGTGPVLVDLKQDRPSALQEKPGAQMAKAHRVIPPLVVVGATMGIILGAGPTTGVGTCIDRGMTTGADGMVLVGVVGGGGPVPPDDRKQDRPSALQVKPRAQVTRQFPPPLVVGMLGKGPDTGGGRGAGATTGGRGAGATTGIDRGMEPLYAMTKKEADASAAQVVTPPLLGNCARPATKAVAL
jgi:hypothetical protein